MEIIPSVRGLPTVFDKDILIYCISKLMHLKNSGREIGAKVRLTTHDLLVATNRPTNNLGYERLEYALERMAGTVIKTTIETGDEATVEGFSLISAFKYNRKGSMHAQRLRYLEITLCEWLFRAIEAAEVLPISRDYFRLRRPLDRRLYELARKHCGSKEKWRIGIDKLQKKCGSKQERKAFVRHLRETVEADHIPDYALSLDDDVVVFLKRAEGIAANRSISHSPTNAYNQANPVPETPVANAERRIMLSSRAMERVYEIAPRWDKHMLESMYVTWAKDKDAARDEDARFIGWVKSYTKGKAAP
ncbi:replication initiator protein A [Rhodomicrobium vannielii]|uniref:replication initiator protein A n=1 Tax=Rhodomicrobium vannielii TaxID=1069 RepID=UPI0031BB3EDC